MLPYQERVIQEREDLMDKCSALGSFINSRQFTDLDLDMQELLKMQYHAMRVYAGILELRISKF